MLRQLAEEEHAHYRILSDAYLGLNNQGVWIRFLWLYAD